MILFKKKEKIPEIPPAPEFSDTLEENKTPQEENNEDYELPELPSFPNNSQNKNLNQEIIKSAVNDNLSSEENEVEEIDALLGASEETEEEKIPPVFQNKEIEKPSFPRKSSITDFPSSKSIIQDYKPKVVQKTIKSNPSLQSYKTEQKPRPHFNVPRTSKECLDAEPIFVRIDKFQLAKKNIGQIKDKVEEIESLIRKIQQVKVKEEEELRSWLEEVEKLKMRLSEIDSEIFSEV